MPRKLIALFGLVTLIALSACGGGSPAGRVPGLARQKNSWLQTALRRL